MSSLPSGTVTFLFTDIDGSTRLLHELGDAYAHALAGRRRMLREAFACHRGVEMDTQGGAFFVAFGRASESSRIVFTHLCEGAGSCDWRWLDRLCARSSPTGAGWSAARCIGCAP
jgi:class 3 adenylate cyclase